ncbi:hypothetical protein ACFL9U_09570 [Thermodesulfobacteriota bacterium]
MGLNIKATSLLLLIILLFPRPGMSFDKDRNSKLYLITDFSYNIGKGDSKETSQALALFGAKSKAVALSAKYLTHKGLLEHYGKKQGEIFCLAVNEIEVSIIEEKFHKKRAVYYVKIKTKMSSTDFIQAEIKNLELEKAELKFSYAEQMEQYVSQDVAPGRELSRAYRYIRKGQWRIAIIYLDHLEKKYPNWGDIFFAKAIGFYSSHQTSAMIDALKAACSFNHQEACSDLQSLSQAPDEDFKP